MKTLLINQQKNHPIHRKNLQRLTNWLGGKLEAKTAPATWGEVSIVLVNDEGITQANREYFGKNHPTDVISFRYDPIPGEKNHLSGDLIINVDRAIQEGTERSDIDYELALYIAHGFDHLSGADDDTPEKRKKMRATETTWLRQANDEDIMNPFIPPPRHSPTPP